MATTDQWRTIEGWAEHLTGVGHDPTAACILDLRRRVEALEQRQAPAPEPAPAADRPLWVVMKDAFTKIERPLPHQLAAEIDAVAEWLDARGCMDAGDLLRAEARRAREGA